MIIKLGDQSQFYGESADPALASEVQHRVFRELQKASIEIKPLYTGVRGPDVWFEIPDSQRDDAELIVRGSSDTGDISYKHNEKWGNYTDVPLVFPEKRQWRRR